MRRLSENLSRKGTNSEKTGTGSGVRGGACPRFLGSASRSWLLVAWSAWFGLQYLAMIVERKLPAIARLATSLRATLGY